MATVFPLYTGSSRPTARRHARRLVTAVGASLIVHAWLVSELPGAVSRGGAPPRALTVRLVTDIAMPVTPVAVASAERSVPLATPGAPRATRVSGERRDRARAPQSATVAEGNAWLAAHHDPTYYPARQLDVYPSLLEPLAIAYPERALREERSGRLLVLLLIDAAGKVDEVTVVEADPPGYFEAAARRAFEAAYFSAARKSGVPVKSRVLVHLAFDPRDARVAAD